MRRAEGGKAAGCRAVSQPGPGGAGTPAAQPGLRVRRETGSGGHGHLCCKRAAARCKHGPGGGAERGCPCLGALGRGESGERCRWEGPCEGGPRQQPSVSAPASPERSGLLRGAGPKRGRRWQRIPAAGRSLAGARGGGGAAGRWRCLGPGRPRWGWGLSSAGRRESLQCVAFLGTATGFCTARARAFWGKADVCPRRGRGFCLYSPSTSRCFRSREPIAEERQRDNPDLPSHLLGLGVSWGERETPLTLYLVPFRQTPSLIHFFPGAGRPWTEQYC